ncbi:class I SAM-dependent methyltransferase [Bacteriovorax sp. Seq25_V]|uniref:class I SAM-dependent methyltransferase n=1 Tax=Bacteriovorax sp. Seq25_V TaxID=1201288 RepID=UPI00038A299A|nr:class I SAM-dependent methyltransferase [Bacteriovorax sp. Seq25_V]EQC44391.1 putative SAM-dependent methyltransferase [Bacteriovorax sp. Seq25_V]
MTQRPNTIFLKNADDLSSKDFEELASLGREHGVDLEISSDAKLYFKDGLLYLQEGGASFTLKWEEELQDHLKRKYAITKEPLAKALGIKGGSERVVCDCSLGTGKDAMLILSFGAKIIAFERNPLVFMLALDALRRAKNHTELCTYFNKIELRYGVAANNFSELEKVETFYFDPMYPEKKKSSSLPRKEMQVFKKVVGADDDFQLQLESLCKTGKKVVLKRPLKSEVILRPSASFPGKTTRYDLYFMPLSCR